MLLLRWRHRHWPPQRSGLLVGSLALLLPAFFPALFSPLGRAFPSIFSEWNAPQPQHLSHLKGALQHKQPIDKKFELWAPLAPQGWKPCIRSSGTSVSRELPKEYSWSTREYYATGIRVTRVKTAPVHASADWYLENVLPVLHSYGIAAISPFSHRLGFDKLPGEIQRLRCKVNFQALDFVPHITSLGETLVERLKSPIHEKGNEYLKERPDENEVSSGKFAVLHLRFDKDMTAHSACDFGGGKAERLALAKYRQVIWQGRVLNSQFNNQELRGQGRCPLTPEEIGLLLAALGFDSSTRLYLASHKVYGGEARISSLRKLFPLMEDKKSLASQEELAKVDGKTSLLAAVDYFVSIHANIFLCIPRQHAQCSIGFSNVQELEDHTTEHEFVRAIVSE